jgi:hypothetical protein
MSYAKINFTSTCDCSPFRKFQRYTATTHKHTHTHA